MNIENRLKRIIVERDMQKRKGRIAGKITILLSVLLIGIFIGSFFLQNNFSITGFASGALPTVGGDAGNWGTVLNNYLSQEHTSTGGHGNITSNNWTNVSITESQISDFGSYRTLDNLTFEGNGNFTGNLTVSGDVGSGTPDANTLYAKSLPKAWVNFDGTDCSGSSGSCTINSCAVRDNFNVECVDRTAEATYIIYWYRDFANANYSMSGLGGGTNVAHVAHVSQNESQASIFTRRIDTGIPINISVVQIIAFGEQS